MQLQLVDKNLGGASTFYNGGIPEIKPQKPFKWKRVKNPSQCDNNEFLFFTDIAAYDAPRYKACKKILILSEPYEINRNVRSQTFIKFILDNYDFILTHDPILIGLGVSKIIKYYHGGTWIRPSEQVTDPDKHKLVSFISSTKIISTGHKLRHEIFKRMGSSFDAFGELASRRINNKVDMLRDYMYSITIENCKQENYFTEKIIDCFLTKTIPIYFGSDTIDEIFNTHGIIRFNVADDLPDILSKLNRNDYYSRINAVNENYKIALKYITFEDNLINIIDDFLT